MESAIQGLVANLALVLVFAAVWSLLGDLTQRLGPRPRQAGLGVVMGLGAITMMALPVAVHDGLFLDLRVSMLAQAGLFGGPIGALVALVLAEAYRLAVGGPGVVAGSAVIVLSTLLGLAVWLRARHRPIVRIDVLLLAAGVAVISLPGILLVPAGSLDGAMSNLLVTVPSLAFLATLLAGFALLSDERRRRTEKLNQTYRQVIETLPEALNVKDAEGRFTIANAATAKLMRADSAEMLIGSTDADFYPPDTAARFRAEELALPESGPTELEQRLVHRDGSELWLSTLKVRLHDESGRDLGLVTHNRDITWRKQLEQDLQRTRDQLTAAMSGMADALIAFDRDGTISFCNEQYRQFFPLTADLRVPGVNLRTILRGAIERGEQRDIGSAEVDSWIEAALRGLAVDGEREIHLSDGRWLHSRVRVLADGTALSVMSDITRVKQAEESLSEINRKLQGLASTDGLTGLSNRRAFDEALVREFARANRNRLPLSLLMVDVDRFKQFNDIYGHQAGDEALQAIAACLGEAARRPTDMAARYGGEEFALILPDTDAAGARNVAEGIGYAVRRLGIPNDNGVVTISIGVATMGRDMVLPGPDELIRRADAALYGAKQGGRDLVVADGDAPAARRA